MTIFKEEYILKSQPLSERREKQILLNTRKECFVGPLSSLINLQLPSTCLWQLSHNSFDISDCPTCCDVVTQDCWAGETGPEAYRTALCSLQTATAGEALFGRNFWRKKQTGSTGMAIMCKLLLYCRSVCDPKLTYFIAFYYQYSLYYILP